MNETLIHKAAHATHGALLPFPEIVGLLIQAGVEFYHVDYLSLATTFHDGAGERITVELPYEDLPPVAADFDGDAVRAAILDSQLHGQSHEAFTRRAMIAGTQGYHAFLRGQRVVYAGRQGDQHVEWFPGAR